MTSDNFDTTDLPQLTEGGPRARIVATAKRLSSGQLDLPPHGEGSSRERRVPTGSVRIFSTLEDTPQQRVRRWASFGAGVGTHALALLCVLAAGIIVPGEMQPFLSKAPVYIELIKPPRVERVRVPRTPKPMPVLEAPNPQRIQIPLVPPPDREPAPELPKIANQEPPPSPTPMAVPDAPQPVLPSAVPQPRTQAAPIETGVFGGNSATATLKLPPKKVPFKKGTKKK